MRCFSVLFLALILTGCAPSYDSHANENDIQNVVYYSQKEKQQAFNEWKKTILQKQALAQGISQKTLNQIIPQLKLLEHVLSSDQKQSEFLLSFWDYSDKTISQARIDNGKKMLATYQPLLQKVYEKYGVDPAYIVAFWGMETNYGTFKGNIKTLDALATLAFDKRRRAFFTKELITLLKMIDKGEKTAFYGSWAGAFGNFQFMPTTYEAYAVDADDDGKKDIINSLPDAFESAGNYLSKMRWENASWGREVILPDSPDWDKLQDQAKRPVSEWLALGITLASGQLTQNEESTVARLVMPQGVEGPVFLTYPNYDKIMRWNNSTLYALSVGILSDKLRDETYSLKAKRVSHRVSRDDIKLIQRRLKSENLYQSEIDGILGRGTKKALLIYQKKHHLIQDGYPNKSLLELLKNEK